MLLSNALPSTTALFYRFFSRPNSEPDPLLSLSSSCFFSASLLPLSTCVSVTSSAHCHHVCLSLSPLHSICHPLLPFDLCCFSVSIFLFSPLFLVSLSLYLLLTDSPHQQQQPLFAPSLQPMGHQSIVCRAINRIRQDPKRLDFLSMSANQDNLLWFGEQ